MIIASLFLASAAARIAAGTNCTTDFLFIEINATAVSPPLTIIGVLFVEF